ncbi:CPBP family intramembrane glutamic endopeptidase [Occallatibacter savannae]|uniref:CPBP family intramembrane glutamic endopeptidase n=1 Tax=Occallatibacter savannae TaxID=1002691 RepID=UPI000D687555|nr:CPBP family intramembrane glutamic endopeptidase [Occallatibacter savannae]
MELEPEPQLPQTTELHAPEPDPAADAPLAPVTIPAAEQPEPYRGLKWIFIGPYGLRSGWSVLIFVPLLIGFMSALALLFAKMHLITKGAFTPKNAIFSELFQLIALIAAAAIVALIERRSILDYNLRGSYRAIHFFSGFVIGFLALSALVGGLAAGHWLSFGPSTLSGGEIVKYALVWGSVFLMVGCFEEGTMRCYLQYTFTRGLNFWGALGIIGSICGLLLWRTKGEASWGVYMIAGLGLFPCLYLHLRKTPQSGFWYASWLTSVLFGAAHTGNNGENWIGIFAAALIGFIFCVSIWVTGSAWCRPAQVRLHCRIVRQLLRGSAVSVDQEDLIVGRIFDPLMNRLR